MTHRLIFLLFALWLGAAAPAWAADGGEAPVPAAAEKALPDRAQIDQAIKLLEDDAARDRLVRQLKALAHASEAVNGEEERVTVGARVLAEIRDRMAAAQDAWATLRGAVASWPAIVAWVNKQADNPAARERWTNFAIALAEVLAAGYAARALMWWVLGRPRRFIESRAPATTLGKLPLLLTGAALNALPAAALAVAAYGVLALSDPAEKVRLAALPIINASVAIQLALLVGAFVVSPAARGLRLLPIDSRAATRAMNALKLVAAVGFYGWFLTESAFVLGLPKAAYLLILKLVGGLVALMVIAQLYRSRRAVARLVRGDSEGADDETISIGEARRRLADFWHVVAMVYVAVACAVWLMEINGGFVFLARATAVTAVALLLAQAVAGALRRGLSRPVRLSAAAQMHFPSLERRLDGYRPWVLQTLVATVWVAAGFFVVDGWGGGALAWLASPVGQRVAGSALTIAFVVAAAVVAWEMVSLTIERALAPDGRNGGRVERSARVRTLLPLLRNAFLIVLLVFVGLFSLAELGVNIAPLLAGAGVIGLAIGFGSQTLVKDVITGLFILIEDTISVGDVVDVGGGHIGGVEAISIRTIRLRDVSGAVHTVPFSAVTTVRNMTKDFSYAVFDVQVAYTEDPDHIAQVLKDIAAGMEADETFQRDIIAPLEVLGLDRLADSGIIIKARFKTRPIRQWVVAREFNRRMKKRFEELGISMPYPHMQLVLPPTAAPTLGLVLDPTLGPTPGPAGGVG